MWKNEATINHPLIHCEYTNDLWHLVLSLFRVSWAMPNNILVLVHCWKIEGRGHPKEAIWIVIHAFLMWSIWRERNQHLFMNCESNVLSLESSFLRSLLDWIVVYVPNFSSSNLVELVNFLDCRTIGMIFSLVYFLGTRAWPYSFNKIIIHKIK
jgi:hypothetical protein